jgi:hypothetical protein
MAIDHSADIGLDVTTIRRAVSLFQLRNEDKNGRQHVREKQSKPGALVGDAGQGSDAAGAG